MKLRPPSKLVLAAVLGLSALAASASAQILVNVSQKATFGPFMGGINNNVTNNGTFDVNQVITTGTPLNSPFFITYDPQTNGPTNVNLNFGTLVTTTFVFDAGVIPTNYFSSVAAMIETDFDSDGSIDLVQNYMLNLSPFVAPNGLNGVNYSIVPTEFFGTVTFNGETYGYASAVANSVGTLFDGSNTQAAIQFQFIANPVPESSSFALAGVLALGGIVALRRRRNPALAGSALAV